MTSKKVKSFIKLEEANNIDQKEFNSYYRKNINSALFSIFKLLGFSKIDIESAQGSFLYLKNKTKVLDYSGACGSLNLGHNHPEIINAEKFCHENNTIDALKFGVNKLQAILAHNISTVLPEELDTTFFSTSGAEANEAAIKLVTKAQGSKRKYIIRTKGSFHGKTHGALAFTESENFSEGFHLGFPRENILTIPFNNLTALTEIIEKYPHEIAGIILEPIQGQDIVVPDQGYLKELQKICSQNNILTIFDEYKIGLGRSGSLFYFQSQEVTPDILTMAKSLGGGKRAIGAMVTSRSLWEKAFGKKKDATLHSSTFSGLGGSCAVAIKSLEIFTSSNFLQNVNDLSEYFFTRLDDLKKRYPKKISSLRGRGLIIGIEFNFPISQQSLNIPFAKNIHIAMMGSIVRELLLNHNVLTYFNGSSPNILNILPPLNTSKEEIDFFIDALNQVLDQKYTSLIGKFCKGAIS